MAQMNFGGVVETVVTSKEFSLEKTKGSKEDKIKGINWGLKNGVLTKEEYDQRMKEIEEEFKNK